MYYQWDPNSFPAVDLFTQHIYSLWGTPGRRVWISRLSWWGPWHWWSYWRNRCKHLAPWTWRTEKTPLRKSMSKLKCTKEMYNKSSLFDLIKSTLVNNSQWLNYVDYFGLNVPLFLTWQMKTAGNLAFFSEPHVIAGLSEREMNGNFPEVLIELICLSPLQSKHPSQSITAGHTEC